MNINISEIIEQKLAQMEADGTIKQKIEESLEKSIMQAISSELESYSFRSGIEKQLKEAVSNIASDCGLPAYNGFIAERCKSIVQHLFTNDISDRIEKALNDIMFTKYEKVKLSDIFKQYRKWVLENTDESDKYENERFTHELEVTEDGYWTRYVCKFADHILKNSVYTKDDPDIEIHFSTYRNDSKECSITMLYINGHYMKDSFKIGHLTDFEAFILNLYYNDTKIILDAEDVEEDPYFDVDI